MSNQNLIGKIDTFGLAITHFRRKSAPVQLHVGMVFKERVKGKLNLLHLAAHYDLRCDPLKNKYKCILSEYFDADELDFFAETAARVWEKNGANGIPYGFRYSGASDFNGDLAFKDSPGAGLTCATFVLAFFSALGYEIVDIADWEVRPDDAKWQGQIYGELRESLTAEESSKMKTSIGEAFRYRPEEVAGSYGGYEGMSLGFKDAVVMGENLLLEYGPC